MATADWLTVLTATDAATALWAEETALWTEKTAPWAEETAS
ncbi:hypothetical protein [Streptomyces sp. NPDC058476]